MDRPAHTSHEELSTTRRSQSTILLVEDDVNDVLFVRRAFSKARIPNPVQVVDDGEKATAYLEGDGVYADRGRYPVPHLILLDLELPRKTGFEVLGHVRSTPVVRRIPVVVLTSSVDERDVERAYDLGVNSYLVKPVGFDALLELVRRLELYWVATNRSVRAVTST